MKNEFDSRDNGIIARSRETQTKFLNRNNSDPTSAYVICYTICCMLYITTHVVCNIMYVYHTRDSTVLDTGSKDDESGDSKENDDGGTTKTKEMDIDKPQNGIDIANAGTGQSDTNIASTSAASPSAASPSAASPSAASPSAASPSAAIVSEATDTTTTNAAIPYGPVRGSTKYGKGRNKQ